MLRARLHQTAEDRPSGCNFPHVGHLAEDQVDRVVQAIGPSVQSNQNGKRDAGGRDIAPLHVREYLESRSPK